MTKKKKKTVLYISDMHFTGQMEEGVVVLNSCILIKLNDVHPIDHMEVELWTCDSRPQYFLLIFDKSLNRAPSEDSS